MGCSWPELVEEGAGPESSPPTVRFSGALITNVPGPFLSRPEEEIKCQQDKEISLQL